MDFFAASKYLNSGMGTVKVIKWRIVWIDEAKGTEHATETLHVRKGDAIDYACSVLKQVQFAFGEQPIRCSYYVQPVEVITLSSGWN